MPPRISLTALVARPRLSLCSAAPIASVTALLASLSLQQQQQQARAAHILASLRDNKGAYNKRKRVGRGPSSGYGKTSGRGHKGQKQHGKVKPWFQGGQTPLIVVKGRKGFDNTRAAVMSEVNIDTLQAFISSGRIDPSKPITPKEIIASGLSSTVCDGIKLLARGGTASLTSPIDICVSRASAAAIAAVEAVGGRIVTRYYTKDSIRRLLTGESVHSDKPLPLGVEHIEEVLEERRKKGYRYRLPDPTSRWDIEYYRDPAHRGYLSHLLAPGESPSLFFRVPPAERTEKAKKEVAPEAEKEKLDRIF